MVRSRPRPPVTATSAATIVIRIDASLIDSHSDKQHAAGNFKGGWGFHPLMAWCDNTGELLAIIPRPGNAGSNTAADHIAIIDAAIAAVPPSGGTTCWSPSTARVAATPWSST